MHSQTTSSSSESSIAHPNYKTSKRVANPKLEPSQTYCKSMGTNIIHPASITTSVSSEESTNVQYLHSNNCRHKFTTISNYRAMKGIVKEKSLQHAAPQPDILEASYEARGGPRCNLRSDESKGSNSYFEPIGQSEAQPPTDVDLESEEISSQRSGSKSSSSDKLPICRRAKKKQNVETITDDVHKNVTFADCLAKLKSIDDISIEGIFAIQDALLKQTSNQVIFMYWSGEILRRWIEYIVSEHPKFHNASAWK